MKLLAITLAVFTLPAFAQAPKPDPKTAKVERLLALTSADAQADKTMDQIYRMVSSNFPSDAPPDVRAKIEAAQAKVFALIRERMGWQQLKPHYVKMYTELFTDPELDGMIAFYESPAGRAMLAKTPEIMQRTIQLTQGLMAELMPELKRITAESVQQ